jgi:hypothetical protein
MSEEVTMEDVRKAMQPAFDHLLEEVKRLEDQAKGKKIALNEMAKSMGIDIPFPKVEEESTGMSGRIKIRIDQFLGKPLATAVSEYLRICGKGVGAKHWTDIVQALRDGGFELGKTRMAEDAARTTILKNTTLFKLVGDDAFGLVEWYPKLRKEKDADDSAPKKIGRPKKVEPKEESSQVARAKKETNTELPDGNTTDGKQEKK